MRAQSGILMDLSDRYGNRRQWVERLVSAWNQESDAAESRSEGPGDPRIGTSAELRRRPRTRLTDDDVDAMRVARANGVSVIALARQFGVYRGTICAKARRALSHPSVRAGGDE